MSDTNIQISEPVSVPIARGYTTPEGSRVTLRFDASTWDAIDYLAARGGFKNWASWVHGAVPHRFENNRHADIRAAVSESLMQICRPLEVAAGDQVFSIQAPILAETFTVDDAQLAAELGRNGQDVFLDNIVPLNFGGFTVRTGRREGRHCVWIENSVRGMRHLVLPIPEWVGQMAVANAVIQAQLTGRDTADNT